MSKIDKLRHFGQFYDPDRAFMPLFHTQPPAGLPYTILFAKDKAMSINNNSSEPVRIIQYMGNDHFALVRNVHEWLIYNGIPFSLYSEREYYVFTGEDLSWKPKVGFSNRCVMAFASVRDQYSFEVAWMR